MILPIVIIIPCIIAGSYEFWQEGEIIAAKNELMKQLQGLPSDRKAIEDLMDAYGFNEIDSLQTELLAMLPEEFNDEKVELSYSMDSGVVMEYDASQDKIFVNFFLARHLFFDKDGKKTRNEKLFHVFLKHELAHREFADPENRVRFFIHENFSWLEEFLVSFGDVFRPLIFRPLRPIKTQLQQTLKQERQTPVESTAEQPKSTQEASKPLEELSESARMTDAELEIYRAQSQLDKDIFEQTKDSQISPGSNSDPRTGRTLSNDTIQASEDARCINEIAIESVQRGNITVGDFNILKLILSRLINDSVPKDHRENSDGYELESDEVTGLVEGYLKDGDTAYALPDILEFVVIAIKGLAKIPFVDGDNVFDSLGSFLDKEEDLKINPEFVQGDINSLYRALALARFCIVLCNATYKETELGTVQKEDIVNSLFESFTLLEIILERLRSRLPAESIGRETARKDLEETYKYHIQIVKELLEQSTETNKFPRITQDLLDRMGEVAQRLPKSDYPQQPEEYEESVELTTVEQQQEKSAESAESTAESALKIGAELAVSSAALTAANGLSLELIESMRVAMNSFADFERFQLAEIQKAEQIAKANSYYSDSTSEEKKELINRLLKVLPSDLAAEFMQHFSDEEIRETGIVMSYNPESDVIRVNYALLRAMFIDESSEDIKNINLFKVFVKHELKHREFAKSSNPLYKAVHAISTLEEFFVSMGDIYAWQELHGQQGALPSYDDMFRFILSNAKYISILADISLEEATIIAQLTTMQEEDPYSFDINDDKKSLRLVVVDSADGLSNSDALSNAQTWTQNGYSAALIEHLPSEGYINDCYVMPSYNISFGEMVYEVYIRQVNGTHFIGLKLKSGQDTTQNFAAAVQFFANDINTNARLRQAFGSLSKLKDSNPSYGIERDLEINSNGVAMIDFIGMQIDTDTIAATQRLYQSGEVSSGLIGTYTVVDMPVTNDTLTEVEQDIKASMLHKLDRPEKFYQVDMPNLRLSDSDFIERAVKIKKKEGATTLILNINDLDLAMLSSESMIEALKGFITIVHSFKLTATIQIDASKINEELCRNLLVLGFDGISIEAQDIEDVNLLKQILEELAIVSRENSVSEKNTIRLKNQSVRDSLGDLAGMNILTITKIDEETHQAELDEGQAREAIALGYERGRRVLEQKISADAKNIRALLNIITQDPSTISAGEIMQAIENAGINAILQKHIGIILKGVDSNLTGTNTKVLEAIGFVRGLIEAYTISRYLETFSISFEMFNTNDLNEIRALGVLLTALLIIDRDNKFFKDSFALRSFFEQANTAFGELSTEYSLSELKGQIISFANLVVERFANGQSIADIALDNGNPSQKLYMSLAVLDDLINKISFSNIVDNAKRRALGSTKQQTRSILGAA
jgi:hypothetical protein